MCILVSGLPKAQGSVAGDGALAQSQGMVASGNPTTAKFVPIKFLWGVCLFNKERKYPTRQYLTKISHEESEVSSSFNWQEQSKAGF